MSFKVGGKAIIVSAPSGAGKTTLVKHLLSRRSDISFSISATNRPKRGQEVDGVDYHFLETDSFKRKIKEGEFIEWEEVYEGRFYGTLIAEIERIWNADKHVIFDVDVFGGLHLKDKFGENAIAIFISPGDIKNLESRLKLRSVDSLEEIQLRMNKARVEMDSAIQFDEVIVNIDLDEAKRTIEQTIDKFLGDG